MTPSPETHSLYLEDVHIMSFRADVDSSIITVEFFAGKGSWLEPDSGVWVDNLSQITGKISLHVDKNVWEKSVQNIQWLYENNIADIKLEYLTNGVIQVKRSDIVMVPAQQRFTVFRRVVPLLALILPLPSILIAWPYLFDEQYWVVGAILMMLAIQVSAIVPAIFAIAIALLYSNKHIREYLKSSGDGFLDGAIRVFSNRKGL